MAAALDTVVDDELNHNFAGVAMAVGDVLPHCLQPAAAPAAALLGRALVRAAVADNSLGSGILDMIVGRQGEPLAGLERRKRLCLFQIRNGLVDSRHPLFALDGPPLRVENPVATVPLAVSPDVFGIGDRIVSRQVELPDDFPLQP